MLIIFIYLTSIIFIKMKQFIYGSLLIVLQTSFLKSQIHNSTYFDKRIDIKQFFNPSHYKFSKDSNPLKFRKKIYYFKNIISKDTINLQNQDLIFQVLTEKEKNSEIRKTLSTKILKDTIISVKTNTDLIKNVRNIYYKRKNTTVLEYYIQYNNTYLRYIYFTNTKCDKLTYNKLTIKPKNDFKNLQLNYMANLKKNSNDFSTVFGELLSLFYENPIKLIESIDNIYQSNRSDTIPKTIKDRIGDTKIDLYSFVGQYDKMFKYKNKFDIIPKIKYDTIDFNLQNAIDYIDEISKQTDLFLLNEDHREPQCRWFANQLLATLYNNGYRYLAIEALDNSKDKNYINRNYINNDGFYTQESTFTMFLKNAVDMGFVLIPYETTQYCTSPENGDDIFCMQQRDNIQAQNILKIYEKDDKAKIFVYAGHGHIKIKPSSKGLKFLGLLLKDANKKVFSLNQTTLLQSSNDESENDFSEKIYSTFNVTTPSILKKGAVPFISNESGFYGYEAFVIQPKRLLNKLSNENITPWYYSWSKESPQKIEIKIDSDKLLNSYISIIPFNNENEICAEEKQTIIFKSFIEKAGNLDVYLPKFKHYLIKFENTSSDLIKSIIYDSPN